MTPSKALAVMMVLWLGGLGAVVLYRMLVGAISLDGLLTTDGRNHSPARLQLLLVTLLDPGFTPRVSFAGYGEAPLQIALMTAGWLAVQAMGDVLAGSGRPLVIASGTLGVPATSIPVDEGWQPACPGLIADLKGGAVLRGRS